MLILAVVSQLLVQCACHITASSKEMACLCTWQSGWPVPDFQLRAPLIVVMAEQKLAHDGIKRFLLEVKRNLAEQKREVDAAPATLVGGQQDPVDMLSVAVPTSQ